MIGVKARPSRTVGPLARAVVALPADMRQRPQGAPDRLGSIQGHSCRRCKVVHVSAHRRGSDPLPRAPTRCENRPGVDVLNDSALCHPRVGHRLHNGSPARRGVLRTSPESTHTLASSSGDGFHSGPTIYSCPHLHWWGHFLHVDLPHSRGIPLAALRCWHTFLGESFGHSTP